MPSYEIDTHRSSFDLRFKPGIPGVGARITGLRGRFDAGIDDDGIIDWDHPVQGEFEMRVDDISMGNRFMTFGAKQWMDPKRYDRITGEIVGVRRKGEDGFACDVNIQLKDMDVTMTSTGRFDIADPANITVHGRTMTDPREFGVLMPPFINFMVHTRWRIAISPVR